MTAPLISDRLRRQEVAPRAERAIPDWKNWVRKECTDCDGTEWCDTCMGLRFTFRPPGLTASERRERNWRWFWIAVSAGIVVAVILLEVLR